MPELYRILVVNPGSTSTKVALFENERELFSVSESHSKEDLQPYPRIADQYSMRLRVIENSLETHGVGSMKIDAVAGRGGLLKPIPGGTYRVNDKMLDDLRKADRGEHASNLGGLIAHGLAQKFNTPAFIVDPVVVDELEPVARITGLPEIKRRSIFHALNQRAVAKKAARKLGRSYEKLNLIVAHMGGGISIGCHRKGRVVDVNNALDGDGPFSPERSGGLPVGQFAEMCFSGKYTYVEIKAKLTGKGGLIAHLGTNDIRKADEAVQSGNENAGLVLDAMVYQIAKEIGSAAAVLEGRVDAVVLTGGLALNKDLVQKLKRKIRWIAKVLVYPGEEEMRALATGVLEVLRNPELAKKYE